MSHCGGHKHNLDGLLSMYRACLACPTFSTLPHTERCVSGVALKIMRMFRCTYIEGQYWLAADMRLRCYDGQWAGFAAYAIVIGVLYIVGLPIAVFAILFHRRHKLFGDATDPFVATTKETYGFLYEVYGPSAWWWEVEELVRKLLLSAVVVLFDSGSPLQVRGVS